MSKTLVGVGPYVDWLEAVQIESVATSPQIPSLYVGECGGRALPPLQILVRPLTDKFLAHGSR